MKRSDFLDVVEAFFEERGLHPTHATRRLRSDATLRWYGEPIYFFESEWANPDFSKDTLAGLLQIKFDQAKKRMATLMRENSHTASQEHSHVEGPFRLEPSVPQYPHQGDVWVLYGHAREPGDESDEA